MITLIIENLTDEQAQDIIDFITDRQTENEMEAVTATTVRE